jgi:hypothetical protein
MRISSLSNSLELSRSRTPTKPMQAERWIRQPEMTELNQCAVALDMQRELHYRFSRPETLDSSPSEDNELIPNCLKIDSFNPKTVEIAETKASLRTCFRLHPRREPECHLPSDRKKVEHLRWRSIDIDLMLYLGHVLSPITSIGGGLPIAITRHARL